MKKKTTIIFTLALLFLAGFVWYLAPVESETLLSVTEPEFEEVDPEIEFSGDRFSRRLYTQYPDIDSWQRPEGPLRVGLQVGHWKNAELPDELERLRGTSLGTSGGGKTEVQVNLEIAQATAELLETEGIEVDILPATIPPGYYADAFVAIHADGNSSSSVSGFKATGPWRDYSDRSEELTQLFYEKYPEMTGIDIDSNITRSMRGYYAFNWWRYDHAIHPKTPAIILETGFLTSPKDQQIIIHNQNLAAQAITDVLLKLLEQNQV
jgi:hypothetical protein